MSTPDIELYVEAVGLVAPGLPGWRESAAMLRGESPYAASEMPAYAPNLLPPNERRRATATVRLAFRTAEDAISGSRYRPDELATVFASSEADTPVMHRVCSALAEPQRLISPTDFHNSVHNAAAGYWSIAAGCRLPSTSLSAWDGSFAAGLLEAAAIAQVDGYKVLLVVYDIPLPEPLHDKRPLDCAFGTALVLSAQPAEGAACLSIKLGNANDAETRLAEPALEAVRTGNPAARALPLLQLLAQRRSGSVVLPGAGSLRLSLQVRPGQTA